MSIERLKDLRSQVERAINYIESGMPMVDMTQREVSDTRERHGHCEFIIGDYVVYRRARNLDPSCQPVTHNPQEDAFYSKVDPVKSL